MRNAFAKEITQIAEEDSRVVLLSGDIGNRLFDKFRERFPERFHNCGVAEANMIGVAAGLAQAGLRPVCYTIAPFVTYRCMEQIRVDLCYHQLPVLVVGTGAGLSYASLGVTHHSCEEVGMLRLIPGMTVLAPGDRQELTALLRPALALEGPAYMRIGKKGEPDVHTAPPDLRVGEAIEVLTGSDVCILSSGTLLPEAVAAARLAANEGTLLSVVSMPSVKPLDTRALERALANHRWVATLEEHSVLGGLGGAVAEWMSDHTRDPRRLIRLGAPDSFYHGGGSQEEARAHFSLDAKGIWHSLSHAMGRPS
jgi:transketolase